MSYLVSTALFSGFHALVEELGGQGPALLSRFGLPQDIETRKDNYVPLQDAALLFEFCADSLRCPDFGLRLSQRQGLPILGPVAVLVRNAPDIQTAIQSIRQYLHLVASGISLDFRVRPRDNSVKATFKVMEPALVGTRQVYELYMGNGQLIIQMLVGAQVYAQKMAFPHSRIAPLSVYQDFFHCPVQFEQPECAVDLSMSVLQREIHGADPETARIASAYLAERYGGQTGALVDQVLHLIDRLLPTGYCKIPVVAEQLNLHPRTLQRRLADQGVAFEALVDDKRRLLAERYLRETNLGLTQVSGLLGYSDQSALNRSCQRWFRMRPRQIRFNTG